MNSVERNADVREVINSYTVKLEPTCLDRALLAAVENGHYNNAGCLILKGALDIDAALKVAETKTQNVEMYGLLFLMKAAMTNNIHMVAQLYSPPKCQDTSLSILSLSSKLAAEGKISTRLPIEIAKQMGHTAVMEALLLQTGMTKTSVDWSGLQLMNLELSLSSKISGFKQIYLNTNGLRTLPYMADFQQVYLHIALSIRLFVCLHINTHVYCYLSWVHQLSLKLGPS